MKRIITGVPRAGKTTAAPGARHTDDIISHDWSADSERVATWFNDPGPWEIEGQSATRALRKYLKQNPEGKPADEVVFMPNARIPLNPAQERLAKQVRTVFAEIEPELVRRGVRVRYE